MERVEKVRKCRKPVLQTQIMDVISVGAVEPVRHKTAEEDVAAAQADAPTQPKVSWCGIMTTRYWCFPVIC